MQMREKLKGRERGERDKVPEIERRGCASVCVCGREDGTRETPRLTPEIREVISHLLP